MEYDIWKRKENLENAKEIVAEFKKEDKCRCKMTRKTGVDREKKFQKRRIIRKVYSKNVIWIGQ